jgi:hypothetical protein
MESSDTIADGLRASLAARTFAILQEHLSGIFLVTEEEIITAMKLIWERMKVITEPSSAIALAPLMKPETIDAIPNCREGNHISNHSFRERRPSRTSSLESCRYARLPWTSGRILKHTVQVQAGAF